MMNFLKKELKLPLLFVFVLYGLVVASLAYATYLHIQLMTVQSKAPVREVIPVLTYNITYDIVDYIGNGTLFMIPNRTIIVFYDSRKVFDNNVTSKVYDFFSKRNYTVLLYDANKPWAGIKLYGNYSLPLELPFTTPTIICTRENKVPLVWMIGRNITTEDLFLYYERCSAKEEASSSGA